MAHERAMAIFIGMIMIGSVAGFALNNFNFLNRPAQAEGPEIKYIMDKVLTTEEKVYVLRTGRVLIENLYEPNCTECIERNAVLEGFANQFQGFLVLERAEVLPNETKFQMVAPTGDIRDLENETITYDSLLDIFCDISFAQPRECLLREI